MIPAPSTGEAVLVLQAFLVVSDGKKPETWPDPQLPQDFRSLLLCVHVFANWRSVPIVRAQLPTEFGSTINLMPFETQLVSWLRLHFRRRLRLRLASQRLKLVTPSGRLGRGESVSRIEVERRGECQHQRARISCTNWSCNRLSNRPGMIHFLATRFSGTKRVAGSTWITRPGWWWCAALLQVRKRVWIWARPRSFPVPSWSLRSTPTRTRVPRDGNPVPARTKRNRHGFSAYHVSSAPMTAFIQPDLLRAEAG